MLGSSGDPATLDVTGGATVETLDASLEIGSNATLTGLSAAIDTIGTSGSLTLDEGETLNVIGSARALVNDGGLTLGAGVQLDVNSYTQGASATVGIDVAASTGTGATGSIMSSGAVTLAGTLSLADTGVSPDLGRLLPADHRRGAVGDVCDGQRYVDRFRARLRRRLLVDRGAADGRTRLRPLRKC